MLLLQYLLLKNMLLNYVVVVKHIVVTEHVVAKHGVEAAAYLGALSATESSCITFLFQRSNQELKT